MKNFLTFTLVVFFSFIFCSTEKVHGQNVNRIEYFFNTDPGFGNGIALTGFTNSANISNFSANLNLAAANKGFNTLYIRAKDASGNWSITNSIPFLKAFLTAPANVARVEYFLNTDPGFGNGTSINLPFQSHNNLPLILNLASTPNGLNTVYIRTLDANGVWSITNQISFIKANLNTPSPIVMAEYFMNTDPGFGQATALSLLTLSNISNQAVNLDISNEANGMNNVYIRAKDSIGIWSITNSISFIKGSVQGNMVAVEYFIDNDPGFGLATPAAFSATAQNINNYFFNADVSSSTAGNHQLFLRAKDNNGKWSLTNVLSFNKTINVGVTQITDASLAYTAYPNPANNQISLKFDMKDKPSLIEIMDAQGKYTSINIFDAIAEQKIDISSLSNGVYFLKINCDKKVTYKKIIKE